MCVIPRAPINLFYPNYCDNGSKRNKQLNIGLFDTDCNGLQPLAMAQEKMNVYFFTVKAGVRKVYDF